MTNAYSPGQSYAVAIEQFGTPAAASKYAGRHRNSRIHRREERCIAHCLASTPPGSLVLDLPCGTGRLEPLLVGMGYRVVALDSSLHMIERAKKILEPVPARGGSGGPGSVRFAVGQVLRTGYADGTFDAVVCNRLFHHFAEPETRRAAFAELSRICRGPIVVSFFNRLALSACTSLLRKVVRGGRPSGRYAISLGTFLSDAEAAGLYADRIAPTLQGISQQWYVRLRR